jgi:hypothetical protein
VSETQNDTERGLYGKYKVMRLNDWVGKHDECRYFVLDPIHDKHAVTALIMYIASCQKEYPELAKDLDLWLEAIDA